MSDVIEIEAPRKLYTLNFEGKVTAFNVLKEIEEGYITDSFDGFTVRFIKKGQINIPGGFYFSLEEAKEALIKESESLIEQCKEVIEKTKLVVYNKVNNTDEKETEVEKLAVEVLDGEEVKPE